MEYKFNTDMVCECGKVHKTAVEDCLIESGAINKIPQFVKKYNATKAFIIGDVNTFPIAGDKIADILAKEGIGSTKFVFQAKRLIPDEKSMGSLILNYDAKCDFIIAIGSGVINDISKILANIAKVPYMIVASAAYMDGYAAGTSSMEVDGVKKTVNAKSPEVIIGDIDILNGAPVHMAKSGLGDMLAKYISICEWKIAHLVIDEYYCDRVAQFTIDSRDNCAKNAAGLLTRDPKAMEATFGGLIDCGRAMDYAGCSRPGGGVEHYFSHIWDMRGIDKGTKTAPHGTQAALGTLYAIKAYKELLNIVPDREKALEYVKSFDYSAWSDELREFVGKGAEAMIALEAKEQKYDAEKHKARLEVILAKWDEIRKIIEELPTVEEFEAILDSMEAPKSLAEVGMDDTILGMTLKCTKDIRDKYVLSKLLWDLGVLDEICEKVYG